MTKELVESKHTVPFTGPVGSFVPENVNPIPSLDNSAKQLSEFPEDDMPPLTWSVVDSDGSASVIHEGTTHTTLAIISIHEHREIQIDLTNHKK
jgi:hypothetical protein